MEKILKEYINILSNEQAGLLARLTIQYENENTHEEINDKLVFLIFENHLKAYVDNKKRISKIRSEYAKLGGGRPKKNQGGK